MDHAGYAHVVYSSDGIQYGTNRSGAWEFQMIDGNEEDAETILVDENGYAHVNYGEDGVYYATNLNGSWEITELFLGYCFESAMAMDPEEFFHLSYSLPDMEDFRYATNKTGTWSEESFGIERTYPFISVDDSGNVHMANCIPNKPKSFYITNIEDDWTESFLFPGYFVEFEIDSSELVQGIFEADAAIWYVTFPSGYGAVDT